MEMVEKCPECKHENEPMVLMSSYCFYMCKNCGQEWRVESEWWKEQMGV